MNELIVPLLLATLHSSSAAHNMVPFGPPSHVEQSGWESIKALLEKPTEKKVGVFVLLINPVVVKQHEAYIRYVVRSLEHVAQIYAIVIDKHNLLPENEEFYFSGVDLTKPVMLYLQEKMNPADNQTLKKWIRQHPAFFVLLTNRGKVTLMQNADNLNHHLMLTWVEKTSRIPLLKYAKQMNSISDISVSVLNVLVILSGLFFFVLGTRQDNFFMRQMSTLPIALFPAGHVYNQIHGNSPGDRNFLGVAFSSYGNGQALSESYFVFILYTAITFGLFNLSESFKVANQKQEAAAQRRLTGRGRLNRKGKGSGKNGGDSHQVVYFMVTIAALGLLYQSYLLKY